MARIFLTPSESSEVGRSQSTVFGQNETAESVILQADSKTIFDGSFNKGGDTIKILGNASLYTASVDGGNLVLTAANGARIVIPYGSAGATIVFNDATRLLTFNAGEGVSLGSQVIEGPAEAVNPGTVTPTPSTIFRLGVSPVDIIDGTTGNDLFRATVQQNILGQQANSLGTGDELDGKAGIDTLSAQLTEGVALSGANVAVQPIVTNVENINFEALSNQQGSNYLTYGTTEIYVNAKDIQGHVRFASNYSDGNLTIQDATTIDSTGSIRNLSALTVAMEYTGNDDSRWEESDFSVLFDQDYLNPELVAVRSARVELQAMNEDNYDKSNTTEPLAGVYFSQLKFTLNGQSFDLAPYIPADQDNRPGSDGRELTTYSDLLSAVQAAIIGLKADNPGNAALQTLTATLGDTFTTDISPVTGELRQGTSIDLTVAPSTAGETNNLTAAQTDLVLIPTPGLDPNVLPNSNRYERANFVPPESEEQLAINIDLEKVGRAGDGGELVVGSMNKYDVGESTYFGEDGPILQVPSLLIPQVYYGESPWNAGYNGPGSSYYDSFSGPNGVITSLLGSYGRGTLYKSYPNVWNDDFAESGISTFNVTVYGGADKPSSLSGLHSTNNTLRAVNVVTDPNQTGTFADLEIGNDNTVGGRRGAFKDVATFNSTAFKADVSLVAAFTEEADSKYNPDNQDPTEEPIIVRYDFGIGNDSLDMEIGENYSQMLNVNINMGGGDDSAFIIIDGDAVDAVTESFFLNLGEGNNRAIVFDTEFYGLEYERQDPQGVTNTVSGLLNNLTILSGSGEDFIEVGGNGQYYIATGNGSDTVLISPNVVVTNTSGSGNNGNDGDFWLWDPNIWDGGLDPLGDGIPLYKAQLQIRYAGFEGTANIQTGADLIATETDFNNAIRAAIASNSELKRMIETELGTIDQNLLFRTLIGGLNQLELTVWQPQLQVADLLVPLTGTQTRLLTGDTNALEAALIDTGYAEDSAAIAAADASTVKNVDVVAYFNAATAAAFDGLAGLGVVRGNVNGTNASEVGSPNLEGYVFYAHVALGQKPVGNDPFGNSGEDYLNHSIVDLGKGANDLVVLSPNDQSHNVVRFTDTWGKVSIVNFFTNEDELHAPTTPVAFSDGSGAPGTFQGLNGIHQLDFTELFTLNTKISSSGSSVSSIEKLIGVYDARTSAALASSNEEFQANNIVFTNIDRLEEATGPATGVPNLNFESLTTTQVQAALNAAGGFGSDSEGVGGPGQLVTGTTQRQSLLFVENVDTPYQTVLDGIIGTAPVDGSSPAATQAIDYANYGSYKVYRVTYGDGDTNAANGLTGGTTNGHFNKVEYMGEIDFGNSVDLSPVTSIPGQDTFELGDREYYAAGYDTLTALTFNIVNGAYEIG